MVLINAWFSESNIGKPSITIEYLDDNNVLRFTKITREMGKDVEHILGAIFHFTSIYSVDLHAIISSSNTHNFFEYSQRRKGISDDYAYLDIFYIDDNTYGLDVLARIHRHAHFDDYYLSLEVDGSTKTYRKIWNIFAAVFDVKDRIRSDLVIG